jgi:hypothetical protein
VQPYRENVIRMHLLRPRPSFCQDCDPLGTRPFLVEFHADPRTGDILTPCPACGRHALLEILPARRHRETGN